MEPIPFDFDLNVNIFHVFLVSFPLLYISYKQDKTNPQIFDFILGLGVASLIYHSINLAVGIYNKINEPLPENENQNS